MLARISLPSSTRKATRGADPRTLKEKKRKDNETTTQNERITKNDRLQVRRRGILCTERTALQTTASRRKETDPNRALLTRGPIGIRISSRLMLESISPHGRPSRL